MSREDPLVLTVDIATTNITKRKALFLRVREGDDDYTITVEPDNVLRVHIKRRNVYGFQPVITAARDRVLAYALRRAICRGFDQCEIVETNVAATIDLGELPK